MSQSTGTVPAARHAGDRYDWPALPFEAWQDTFATLHRWAQIVGKTRLGLAPMMNHWWQATFYITARGFNTGPMPHHGRTFEIEFDFIDHALVIHTDAGEEGRLALVARSVADFYQEYRATLRRMGLDVACYPRPVEMDDVTRFDQDRDHASYDAEAAARCWRAMVQVERVLKIFRGRFLGKVSPVQLYWGAFDLACTRFSGRRAPTHPGGIPNIGDHVMHEAYSHECISAGWWPGGAILREPAFYSYAYPEPAGFAEARVRPAAAYWHRELREFVLPYEAVRTAEDPDAAVLEFLQSTYERGADLAGWDRAALERASG
jgi:hypothetical protein